MTEAVCPLCGGRELIDAGNLARDDMSFGFARCQRCGFFFVCPRPAQEAIHAYYAAQGQQHTQLEERARQESQLYEARFHRRLQDIARFITPPGQLLDVGCQLGLFLAAAARRGWRVEGVELAAEAAAEAHRRTEAPIRASELAQAQYASASFDVVTCWHLIEHVLDPMAFLREARRILKPGGVLAVETPNIASSNFRRRGLQWEYVIPPEHINYFDAATLDLALTQAGFAVCYRTHDQGTSVGQTMQQLGLGRMRQWGRRHYQWVKPLRDLYLATIGRLSPQEDILIMLARPKLSTEES